LDVVQVLESLMVAMFGQDTAQKFNIVRYCLFASPVYFLSLVFHLPKFNAEGLIPSRRVPALW
jgi:hypothetical protein